MPTVVWRWKPETARVAAMRSWRLAMVRRPTAHTFSFAIVGDRLGASMVTRGCPKPISTRSFAMLRYYRSGGNDAFDTGKQLPSGLARSEPVPAGTEGARRLRCDLAYH